MQLGHSFPATALLLSALVLFSCGEASDETRGDDAPAPPDSTRIDLNATHREGEEMPDGDYRGKVLLSRVEQAGFARSDDGRVHFALRGARWYLRTIFTERGARQVWFTDGLYERCFAVEGTTATVTDTNSPECEKLLGRFREVPTPSAENALRDRLTSMSGVRRPTIKFEGGTVVATDAAGVVDWMGEVSLSVSAAEEYRDWVEPEQMEIRRWIAHARLDGDRLASDPVFEPNPDAAAFLPDLMRSYDKGQMQRFWRTREDMIERLSDTPGPLATRYVGHGLFGWPGGRTVAAAQFDGELYTGLVDEVTYVDSELSAWGAKPIERVFLRKTKVDAGSEALMNVFAPFMASTGNRTSVFVCFTRPLDTNSFSGATATIDGLEVNGVFATASPQCVRVQTAPQAGGRGYRVRLKGLRSTAGETLPTAGISLAFLSDATGGLDLLDATLGLGEVSSDGRSWRGVSLTPTRAGGFVVNASALPGSTSQNVYAPDGLSFGSLGWWLGEDALVRATEADPLSRGLWVFAERDGATEIRLLDGVSTSGWSDAQLAGATYRGVVGDGSLVVAAGDRDYRLVEGQAPEAFTAAAPGEVFAPLWNTADVLVSVAGGIERRRLDATVVSTHVIGDVGLIAGALVDDTFWLCAQAYGQALLKVTGDVAEVALFDNCTDLRPGIDANEAWAVGSNGGGITVPARVTADTAQKFKTVDPLYHTNGLSVPGLPVKVGDNVFAWAFCTVYGACSAPEAPASLRVFTADEWTALVASDSQVSP